MEAVIEKNEEAVKQIEDQVEQKSYAHITKARALDRGVVEVIVATNSEDRHGEILDIKGLDVKNYMKHRSVLLFHDQNSFPVGKTLSLKKTPDGSQLIAQVQLAIDEYPVANQLYRLVLGEYFNTVSIAFIPKELDQNVWTRSEMVEFSFVPVPANAEALVVAKSKGLKTDQIEEFMKTKVATIEPDEPKEDEPETPEVPSNETLKNYATSLRAIATALENSLSPDPVVKTAVKTVVKRKVLLVRAKKEAQAADRLVELLIAGLKNNINKEESKNG